MTKTFSALSKFRVFLAIPLLVGCGAINSLTATKFAVAVLMSTPAETGPAPGNQMVPALTTLSVFVATVNPADVTSTSAAAGALTPDDSAQVTLTFTNTAGTAVSIPVADSGGAKGAYVVTSAMQSSLALEQVQYTVTIVDGGNTYVLQGLPPMPETIANFASSSTLTNVDVSNGFVITRAPTAAMYPVAFAAVQAMTMMNAGMAPNPTPGSGNSNINWTNVPTEPTDLLNLLLSPAQWETPTFTVPATAFTSPSQTPYVVALIPVSQGTNPTATGGSSLFAGSTILIGAAAAGIVVTK